jgi:hypothetical protein
MIGQSCGERSSSSKSVPGLLDLEAKSRSDTSVYILILNFFANTELSQSVGERQPACEKARFHGFVLCSSRTDF